MLRIEQQFCHPYVLQLLVEKTSSRIVAGRLGKEFKWRFRRYPSISVVRNEVHAVFPRVYLVGLRGLHYHQLNHFEIFQIPVLRLIPGSGGILRTKSVKYEHQQTFMNYGHLVQRAFMKSELMAVDLASSFNLQLLPPASYRYFHQTLWTYTWNFNGKSCSSTKMTYISMAPRNRATVDKFLFNQHPTSATARRSCSPQITSRTLSIC